MNTHELRQWALEKALAYIDGRGGGDVLALAEQFYQYVMTGPVKAPVKQAA
jgi:hypothetical protein